MHPHRLVTSIFAALLVTLTAAPTLQATTPGSAPAATLLLPYFEVDLSGPEALTTLFSVNNAGQDPVVAHVVVWTDRGIPTYSFDAVLGPDDAQTFNLRDLFRDGSVPATDGSAINGCTNPVTVPPLDEAALDVLRRRHMGLADPNDGLCYGSGRLGPNRVTGYVTVDTAGTCAGDQQLDPTNPSYFFFDTGGVPPGGGFVTNDNVLWGDVFYVSSEDDSAQGVDLVHIPYDPDTTAGQTFYRIFSGDGHDGRALLGSRYRGRFFDGGVFDGGTDLLVWLEGVGPSEPVICERRDYAIDTCQSAKIALFDEEGTPAGDTVRYLHQLAFRLEVGSDELPAETPFGVFELDHSVLQGCVIIPIGLFPVQAWVTPVMKANDRFSVGLAATRIPVEE